MKKVVEFLNANPVHIFGYCGCDGKGENAHAFMFAGELN